MIKRTLSLLLTLVMVFGLVPTSFVQAAESNDVVYVDESTSMSDLVDKGLVQMTQPATRPLMPETPTNSGAVSEPEKPEQLSKAAALTTCDCGMENADIYNHSDNCALRLYYYRICAGNPTLIYDLWRNVTQVTRGFLEDYLAANYPEKLPEIMKLRDAEAIPDDSQDEEKSNAPTRLPGEASVTVDGITLDAVGVPEGSSLTIQEPSKDAKELVEQIVAAAEDEPEEVFFYDISVQNSESSDWQPEETSVKLKLTLPGKKLNQYTEVRIIHVDDEGNDSLIEGVVDANGDIVFETGGFSTFAGFTVDFTYGSAMVSIPGKTSTTLGTLFQKMKMPLNAADVVDVQFTDYSLLTVTKEENDWRLTSLVPFTSHETLTFTMADGNSYEFMVTDAQYASIKTGINGTVYKDENGHSRWFADADGTLITGLNPKSWQSAYWAENAIVYIMGPGTFTIAIQPHKDLSKSATVCKVKMKQVRIMDGADVNFYVGTHFIAPAADTYDSTTSTWKKMQTVELISTNVDESLFYVEKGTLNLEGDYRKNAESGSYQEIKLKLIGSNTANTTTFTAEPLVNLRENCTKFTADRLIFDGSASGGVFSQSKFMTLFKMTRCDFLNTVYREKIYDSTEKEWVYMNGGAIYMNVGKDGAEKSIDYFYLYKCNFNGNKAGSYGGAIYLGDRIRMAYINNCSFTNCTSGASGGAICLRATIGQFHAYKSTFTNCTAKKDGGAISAETYAMNDGADGEGTNFNRAYEIRFTETTFTNCKATGEHSSKNDGIGGGVNMAIQCEKVNVSKCTFDGCQAQGGATNLAGGGMAFGYVNLGDSGNNPTGDMRLPWTEELLFHKRDGDGYLVDADGNRILGDTDGNPDTAPVAIYEAKYDTQNKRVLYGNGIYRDEHQGWWVDDPNEDGNTDDACWRQRITFGNVYISNNTTFKNASNTEQGGGFIVRTGCCMEDLTVNDTTFDNNSVTDKGSAVFFNNCIIGETKFNNCTFKNNKVVDSIYSGGGTFRTVGQTSSKMTLDGCKFLDNVGNQAGGGVYWNAGQTRKTPEGRGGETKAIIKNCEFRRNTALKPAGIDDKTSDKTKVITIDRYGGGIFCETDMTIESCIFDGNKSEIGGGLCMGVYNATYRMFNDNEITRLQLDENTEFVHNHADRGGGLAIRANATLAIPNDVQLNHTVEFNLGGAKVYHNTAREVGGGIYYIAETYQAKADDPDYDPELDNAEVRRYIKTINLDSGTVYSNTALIDGGGIYIASSYNTTVNVSDAEIYYNAAGLDRTFKYTSTGVSECTCEQDRYYVSDPGGNGGGIYMTGTDAIVNITGGIIGAHMEDGALKSAGNVAYGRTEINTGGYGGGLALFGGANLSITGGQIIYNKAQRDGGGFSVNDNADVTITGGYIQHNKADTKDNTSGVGKYYGVGGGIAMNGGSVTCYGGVIQENKAYNGGAIALYGGATMEMKPATTEVNGETVTTYVLIDNNEAYNWGGGIYLADATNASNKNQLTIENGTISYNTAKTQNGGGVYVGAHSDLVMNGGEINNNTTATWGGGIWVGGGEAKVTLKGGKIHHNTTPMNGGGLCAQSSGFIKLDGTEIYNNEANEGGGIFATINASVEVHSGKVHHNTATATGGGLSVIASSTIKIIGGEIYQNNAVDGGGLSIGSYNNHAAVLTLADGKIYGNTASNNGGGISLIGCNATLQGGDIYGNTAISGGGIFLNKSKYQGSDLKITDGKIHENNAVFDQNGQYGNGGGIYTVESKVTLEGGKLYSNHAMDKGGAMFSNTSEIIVKNGEIYNNRATNLLDPDAEGAMGDGGALYIYMGSINISGGEIKNNSALRSGGGTYMDRATVTITDGLMSGNSASVDAGGLYIYGGTATIGGGTFTDNTSAASGGGAYFRETEVTFTNGTFTANASKNGGGLCITNSEVDFTGGNIYNNHASADGGGIWISGAGYATETLKTTLTVTGGVIGQNEQIEGSVGNTAAGNGGGIYAADKAQVFITGTTDQHGEINRNTAKNGGGVYVTSGANLTVTDGHITNNRATSPKNAPENLSGFYDATGLEDLHGAGGGICVTAGSSETIPSSFTLNGDNVAIYGNQADFSGDDVFSNGLLTKLNVPKVSEMNLAGYGFKAEGWFEDYNYRDNYYMSGLNMISKNGGSYSTPENTYGGVLRYRDANAVQRRFMHIKPEGKQGENYVSGNEGISGADVASYVYVNKLNAYVAMTLGIPAAADDTVVVDYGSKVTIDAWENDLFMDQGDFANTGTAENPEYHSYIGSVIPADTKEKDGVRYSTSKPTVGEAAGIYPDILTDNLHGKAESDHNGIIFFHPVNMSMDKENTFFYMVEHNGVWYYANVTVVPATTIYYEDNMSQVIYHTESAYEELATWTPVGSAADTKQDEDRPGASVLEGLDADNIYGYDSSYTDTSTYSNGGAHWVTATRHRIEDVNADNICDFCKETVGHNWVDADKNQKCDVCGNIGNHHCKDTNLDHKCDTCQAEMNHTHDVFKDSDKDGICDGCHGTKAHSCIDTRDKNGYCDLCGIMIGTHTKAARATFTFTGTGFDIISLCNRSTGIVMVSVYEGEVVDFDNPPFTEDRYVASYVVDTHAGYVYNEETGKWEYDENSKTVFYQVPVIKADLTKVVTVMDDPNTKDTDESQYKDWGYGTYSVEIYVAPSFLEREASYWSSDFYLDAIRIYNPAGYNGVYDYQYHAVKRDENGAPVYQNGQPVYELVTKKNTTNAIQNAYQDDAEGWPVYTELRNMFIQQKELNAEGTSGVVFIDGKGNTAQVSDYKSWGPNNEVYLNPGEHIAFSLDAAIAARNVEAIHIGMRGLTGKGEVTIRVGESVEDATLLLNTELSTTDLYFNISAKDAEGNFAIADKVIVISNSGEAGSAPISITNVKVTHSAVPEYPVKMLFKSSARTAQIALEILAVEDLVEPVVTPKRPALSFNGMVSYNVFFSAENLGDLTAADLGLAVFSTEDPEGTVETAREVVMGATEIDGLYMIATGGVHAKYLGDKQYFRTFAKKADGTIVYSRMVSYSALDYAKNVLAKSSDVSLKRLVVAMLNYGAEAQKFFGYKTDDLMNKDLTADDQALLAGFDATALKSVGKVDASKVGKFASTGGFTKRSPAISFKGAFEINYFFTPANAVDGEMTLYFWNENTYNTVTELTAENADKAVTMTLENGSYTASSDEIAARYLDRTVYAAAVYESDGVTYCSGVLPYSIATYCQKPPATVQELATAAAIYGCTAKQYFGA